MKRAWHVVHVICICDAVAIHVFQCKIVGVVDATYGSLRENIGRGYRIIGTRHSHPDARCIGKLTAAIDVRDAGDLLVAEVQDYTDFADGRIAELLLHEQIGVVSI